MANEISLKLRIDDKGNLKVLASDADKAGSALGRTGKSARDADRNLKGAAQASSNTTKNFSKMAQGIDGMLVPAYAAFAAQVFALTAVFQFFKRAGNLQVLQQGQIAYASATGVAMKSLTKDIQAATGGQVAFTEAASAAAIGTAAGLSADQLERLGKAAKDTSAVLGRDVTDSFNRLVRGVTKAEPELLDELGIILRLDDASRKYKEALNITGRELTTFEKSQAVANDVLTQSEEKYSRILDIVGGGSVNEFNQLAVALDEIIMKIQKALVPVASTLARVLTDVPLLAGAAFALFISGPLRAMGVSFASMGILSKEASDRIVADVARQRAEFAKASAEVQRYKQILAMPVGAGVLAAGAAPGARPFEMLAAGGGLEKRQVGTIKGQITKAKKTLASGKEIGGDFAGYTLADLERTEKALEGYDKNSKIVAENTVKNTNKMKLGYQGVKATVQSAASSVARFASRMLVGFGWLGIIVTAGLMLKDALGFTKELSEGEKESKKLTDKIKTLNEELYKFVEVQKIIFEDGPTTAALQNLGKGIASQSANLSAKQLSDTLATAQAARARGGITQSEFDKIKEAGPGVMAFGVEAAKGRQKVRAAKANVLGADDQAAVEFIERQKESVALFQEQGALLGVNYTEATAYAEALKSGDPALISETKAEFEALGKGMGQLNRLQTDSESASKRLFAGFAPLTKTEQAMQTLNAELSKLNEIQGDPSANPFVRRLTKEQAERQAQLKKELAVMEEINTAAAKQALTEAERNTEMQQALAIAVPAQREIAVAKVKELQTGDKIAAKNQEIANINKAVGLQAEGITTTQKNRIALLQEEIKGLRIKKKLDSEEVVTKTLLLNIELQKAKLAKTNQITNAEQEVNNVVMKGISIRKEALRLQEQEERAKIDRTIADMERNAPLNTKAIARKRAELELKLQNDLKQARLDGIEEEKKAKTAALDIEYALLDAKLLLLEGEMKRLAIEERQLKAKDPTYDSQEGAATAAAKSIAGIRDRLPGMKTAQQANIDKEATLATDKVNDDIQKAEDAKRALTEAEEKALEFGKTMQSSMESAFMAMVDGSKSAKEAFTDMAQQVLKMIAKMIIEMLVLKALQAIGIPGFSEGGISEKARGGGMFSGGNRLPGYSSGGIARGRQGGYPVMLHGTEAVVPLPNNREIPVEMKGAAGQVNNISVSVNVDGNGQSQTQASGTGNETMGKAMGAAISAAVVDELAKQKRNGGMLSPYGVA
jgi:hypothetical protein